MTEKDIFEIEAENLFRDIRDVAISYDLVEDDQAWVNEIAKYGRRMAAQELENLWCGCESSHCCLNDALVRKEKEGKP